VKLKPVLILVGAMALIAAAVVVWLGQRRQLNPQAEMRPVRCAACEREYVPPDGAEEVVCPYCGSTDRIVLWWYTCRNCGAEFVGVEERLPDHAYRFPGGEWKSLTEFELRPECPECGSRRVSSIRMPSQPAE
jgi:DNA-directed RNA polymerase subunit RPC12/RpoP